MQPLMEQSVQLIADRFAGRGWSPSPQEDPAFQIEHGSEIVFRVGLNVAVKDYGVAFFPSLGVRHVETSRLVRKFKGGGEGRGEAATFGCTLMDLMRQHGCAVSPYVRWFFKAAEEIPDVVNRVCKDAETYGTDFFSSLATLEDLIRRLENEDRYQALNGNLAVAYALAGRRDDATRVLQAYMADAIGQPTPMVDRSWRFVNSFVSYFNLDSSSFSFGAEG
ncbi:hypothetical protein [Streptomyces mayteni]